MSGHGSRSRLQAALIRLALKVYPAELRSEYDGEMRQYLEQQRGEDRYRGVVGHTRFCWDVLWDAIRARIRWQRRRRNELAPTVTGKTTHPTARGLMLSIAADARFAFRTYLRTPWFAAAAILTLGLGIGANAAVLPFLYGILIRPLPFERPDQLAVLFENAPGFTRASASYTSFHHWRSQNTSFSGMGAYHNTSMNLTGSGEPERLTGALISHDLFGVLGVRPLLGRGFVPDEDVPGAPATAILGHGLWVRRFGADRRVVGSTVTFDGESHTVVGIMPPGFRFPRTADFWIPLRMSPNLKGRSVYLTAVGRLAPHVTRETAQLEMSAIAKRLEQTYPNTHQGRGVVVRSLEDDLLWGRRTPVLIFYAAACLVLLLACANVANLLLARSADRRAEIAMRVALGAGRLRITRQLLTEGALLALSGGVAGALIGLWARDLVLSAMPEQFPYYFRFDAGLPVVLGLVGITFLSVILFAMAPVLTLTARNLFDSLRGSGSGALHGARPSRVRAGIVIAEIAIAFVVLVGTGRVLKGYRHLTAIPSGLAPENVLTMQLSLPSERYPDDRQRLEFFQSVRDRMLRLPGVVAVSSVSNLPMTGSHQRGSIYVDGAPAPEPGSRDYSLNRQVQPGYFQLMGIPFIQGRDFDPNLTADAASVVIVDESFAKRYWPGGSAIGKRIKYGAPDSPWPWMQVVGVVGDTRHFALDVPIEQGIYRPLVQEPTRSQTLLVKAASGPLEIVDRLRQEVWSVDPNLAVYNIKTMDQVISATYWSRAAQLWLLNTFSAVALLLAAFGVYGVVAYSVIQRNREFGLRMALGARRESISLLVVAQVTRLAAAGTGCGLLIAVVLMRYASSMFFEVSALDAVTYVLAAALISLVAIAAGYFPARRAARLDPIAVINFE